MVHGLEQIRKQNEAACRASSVAYVDIPAWVYWNKDKQLFFCAKTHLPETNAFHKQWTPLKDSFPTSREQVEHLEASTARRVPLVPLVTPPTALRQPPVQGLVKQAPAGHWVLVTKDGTCFTADTVLEVVKLCQAYQYQWDSDYTGSVVEQLYQMPVPGTTPATPAVERVYVAGPMTGLPGNNYPAFDRAAAFLRSLGYTVVSPAELARAMPGVGLVATVQLDVAAVASCQAVYMLNGWRESHGAQAEYAVAKWLGLRVANEQVERTGTGNMQGFRYKAPEWLLLRAPREGEAN